ncbi:DNA repair and recombination protein RAD54-like [Phytophthora boehmeriae]|uniref:DNA repair and recombination protein RAD54-like n=1 Tax=Phytophthora boehmeriae TaxID=109152 RepID=A0A8T1WXE0_9STRA|nr:DNA repair and recombination protein RAD54-like [Phytophthora boehmeriae]
MSDTHDQLKCDRCHWRNANDPGKSPTVITIDEDDEDDTGLSSEEDAAENDATNGGDSDKGYHPQVGMPPEEDLNSWGHHRSYISVDDEVMQAALQQVQNDLVSFAFSCRIDWELLQEHQAENEEKENQRDEERKRKRLEIVEAANKKRAQEEEKSKKATKTRKRKDSVDSDDLRELLSSSSSEEENEGHAGETESESESEAEFEYLSAPRQSSPTAGVQISNTPSTPQRPPRRRPMMNSLEESSHPVHSGPVVASSSKKRVTFAPTADLEHSSKKQRVNDFEDEFPATQREPAHDIDEEQQPNTVVLGVAFAIGDLALR